MSQPDRLAAKPEPLLTFRIVEGNAGSTAECPEFGVSFSVEGKTKGHTAEYGLMNATHLFVTSLLKRADNGSLPEDITPEQIVLARKIQDARDKGIGLDELFKKV